jgi:hypothetical protein
LNSFCQRKNPKFGGLILSGLIFLNLSPAPYLNFFFANAHKLGLVSELCANWYQSAGSVSRIVVTPNPKKAAERKPSYALQSQSI